MGRSAHRRDRYPGARRRRAREGSRRRSDEARYRVRRNDDGADQDEEALLAAGRRGCRGGGALAPATAAFATDYPDGGSTGTVSSDRGRELVRSQVAGETAGPGQLPFTGGDVAALAAIGGGAVAIGGVLVVQTRKRRTVEAS